MQPTDENLGGLAARGWTSRAIPVAKTATGADLTIGLNILEGATPGPRVALVSTHHGEEIFTADLIRRVMETVSADTITGTLLTIPCANPLAFEWGTRNTPQDGQNMNRVFPGNDGGWVTEIMARAVTDAIVPNIDVLVDFHCGGTDTTIHYTYTQDPSTEKGRKVHDLAMIAGAEVLWETPGPAGTLAGDTDAQGIATVIVEVGGGTSFGTPIEDRAMRGVTNILKHVGMLQGTLEIDPPRVVVRRGAGLRPRHGGLFIPAVGLDMIGKRVAKGTLLGRVVSAHTFEELDRLEAPYEPTEIMMVRDRISKVHPGDYAYILGDGASGYELDTSH
jgi:predicted deacylase